jgi:hypothetical protein
MAGLTHQAIIARLEEGGQMEARREQLRKWFSDHPDRTPVDAVTAHPEWTLPDHMIVIADSIRMDMRSASAATRDPA